MLKVILILDNKFASNMTPERFVKEEYLTEMAEQDLKYINIIQEDNFTEIKSQERWIKFKSNGKYHLMPTSFTPNKHVGRVSFKRMSTRRYVTVCELNITTYPYRVVARDKIHDNGFDEYCPKCLEKSK